MAVGDEQHLLMTFLEDKIAHQTRVTLPGITAQSLGRKSDDADQSCTSSNSLKVSKKYYPNSRITNNGVQPNSFTDPYQQL